MVPKVIWFIVEDAPEATKPLNKFLQESRVVFIHLHVNMNQLITFETLKHNTKDLDHSGYNLHRGSAQRNTAIQWLLSNPDQVKPNSVIYFADDDNSFHIKLFEEACEFSR